MQLWLLFLAEIILCKHHGPLKTTTISIITSLQRRIDLISRFAHLHLETLWRLPLLMRWFMLAFKEGREVQQVSSTGHQSEWYELIFRHFVLYFFIPSLPQTSMSWQVEFAKKLGVRTVTPRVPYAIFFYKWCLCIFVITTQICYFQVPMDSFSFYLAWHGLRAQVCE